jgi:hypothetical protein
MKKMKKKKKKRLKGSYIVNEHPNINSSKPKSNNANQKEEEKNLFLVLINKQINNHTRPSTPSIH